jgi:hypothetical protein
MADQKFALSEFKDIHDECDVELIDTVMSTGNIRHLRYIRDSLMKIREICLNAKVTNPVSVTLSGQDFPVTPETITALVDELKALRPRREVGTVILMTPTTSPTREAPAKQTTPSTVRPVATKQTTPSTVPVVKPAAKPAAGLTKLVLNGKLDKQAPPPSDADKIVQNLVGKKPQRPPTPRVEDNEDYQLDEITDLVHGHHHHHHHNDDEDDEDDTYRPPPREEEPKVEEKKSRVNIPPGFVPTTKKWDNVPSNVQYARGFPSLHDAQTMEPETASTASSRGVFEFKQSFNSEDLFGATDPAVLAIYKAAFTTRPPLQ